MRPNKREAVFHGILSFYPGEMVTDEMLARIAKEYLQNLGITDTQYSVTRHDDKKHLHLHVIANLVNNNGKGIQTSYLGLKGKKTAQLLTKKYSLIPAVKKSLAQTNLSALNAEEATRYEIFTAISDVLLHASNLESLKQALLKLGIDTKLKYKNASEELQGISFKKGVYCFKGSSVDRTFSLSGLQKNFIEKQQQAHKIRIR